MCLPYSISGVQTVRTLRDKRYVGALHHAIDGAKVFGDVYRTADDMSSSSSSFVELPDARLDDIAIIGMACRMPGNVSTTEELWEMLVNGRSGWSPSIPASKWKQEGHYHPAVGRQGSTYVHAGHFLDDGAANGKRFDAVFFNMSLTEAVATDLQHRLALENVYEALENAGLRMEDVRGSRTSVYVGLFANDCLTIADMDLDGSRHKLLGSASSIGANRLSWFFDFRGNSLALDTACSSSMVALHLACNDLRSGASEMVGRAPKTGCLQ